VALERDHPVHAAVLDADDCCVCVTGVVYAEALRALARPRVRGGTGADLAKGDGSTMRLRCVIGRLRFVAGCQRFPLRARE
jgi:hypothetical protein